ncbi:bifunctional hydroxymethylpyrimidine kinase/phosphomethylpyrimidine kinase [Pelagibaculum spongiae]|uniref:hydroxymethylpyrimidine kinase n=1 Tax=Pelagibaculum spongiae TaxID=2080658 RepID=A0A2V1GUM4_9GAMM|nr:bifunctional hydroxymethylpyrimidine kinase/phosphomethylpyrimidine kinase [Pelagibaculum spongiae]PVZ69010.1 bifunctional hydroxymethylpyrimidine kinase/phosphomethylpyrimidine kinase [Pelagibaculum spongiae]
MIQPTTSRHPTPDQSKKTEHKTPIILTIAGSDSGGGAGIQADIKAISATGSYACSVITALTAQNTLAVKGILPISADFIQQQLTAVFDDLNIQAIKIGMLAEAKIIQTIASFLEQYPTIPIVLDPVMVATSGDLLLEQSAIHNLKQRLVPLASIITPNLPEAAALTDQAVPQNQQQMLNLINQLRQLDAQAILLKGGHLQSDSTSNDLLIINQKIIQLSSPRIETENTHGTGCSLSAAIASFIAQGQLLQQAVHSAKAWLTGALAHADQLHIGQGHGPVHHFYQQHNQKQLPLDLSSVAIKQLDL